MALSSADAQRAIAGYLRGLADRVERQGLQDYPQSTLSIAVPSEPVPCDPGAVVQAYQPTGELVVTLHLWLKKEER